MNARCALVIEDDQDLAAIFSEALRAAGFEVQIASTKQAALGQLAARAPDVVTLDLHLAHEHGSDILHSIRSDPHLAKVHVILTTADSVLAESLQNEADFVFVKPISFNQLRDLAARLMLAS